MRARAYDIGNAEDDNAKCQRHFVVAKTKLIQLKYQQWQRQTKIGNDVL